MGNYNVARRQFRMHRDCTIIWLFCSIVGLIEVLFSAESPPFHGWSAFAVGIFNAIPNAYFCLKRRKEMQEEETNMF